MSKVLELDADQLFKELNVPNRIFVVYFSAPWCGPCIGMKPIFEKLSEAYSQLACFGHVDVAQSPTVAKQLNIHGVPSIAVFREGKLSKLIMGSNSYGELQKTVEGELKYLD